MDKSKIYYSFCNNETQYFSKNCYAIKKVTWIYLTHGPWPISWYIRTYTLTTGTVGKTIVKKHVKSKVAAKKWLNGKNFDDDNSNCSETCNKNSPELLLLKFLPLAYHQAISWAPPWISHLFS